MVGLKTYAAIWIVLAAALLAGCAQPAAGSDDLADRRIRVVATTGMVSDLVRNVGGERVEVITLMGPGVDPHLYKASADDVVQLQRADIIFYNGLHLEAAMSEVFERMQSRRRTVAVTDGIPREALLPSDEYDNQFDPHVWFDVTLWRQTVDHVRDALIDLDPSHASIYRTNAKSYGRQLDELHAYVQSRAALIPEDQRVLVTAHDAFRYFGRAYGFEVHGLQGISTVVEAGTADVQQLADFIATRRIPAIFVETSVPQRTLAAVQSAVRARGFEVRIGGELFSDALGDPGTPEGEYIGMVRHNIDTIVTALRGEG
jgi:manganese/zinc/iron transport system substrate-binding protein